jgi:hypothetical protein
METMVLASVLLPSGHGSLLGSYQLSVIGFWFSEVFCINLIQIRQAGIRSALCIHSDLMPALTHPRGGALGLGDFRLKNRPNTQWLFSSISVARVESSERA